jgi:N-acylglucosamine-6-phosphate 2-epimerase
MSQAFFDQIRSGLIVSCQTGDNPEFGLPQDMVKFARAAQAGGACAIRSEGEEILEAIKAAVDLPLIGLKKGYFEDGTVRISRALNEIEAMVRIGVDVVAIDATNRSWQGLNGPEIIHKVRDTFDVIVMADISTVEDGIAALEAGAHCLSTTLAGYTPQTQSQKTSGPDLALLADVVNAVDIPVIAEGRYNTPQDAAQALQHGAWAVVVGSAITRPQLITSWFSSALKHQGKH